jgi:adenylate cyclase
MPDRYRLEISHRDQHFSFALEKEVGLGRQLTPGEPIGKLDSHPGSGEDRIAVAPFSEVRVSRRQLLLRPTAGGIVVLNPSTNVVLVDDTELPPNEQRICPRKATIAFGPDNSYRAHVSLEQDIGLKTLTHEPPRPGDISSRPSDVLDQLHLSATSSAVRGRLKSLIEVLQSAAGSEDFLERAAKSVVELIGLDSALVLLLREGQWRCVAEYHQSPASASSSGLASRRLLTRMQEEHRTVFSDGRGVLSGDHSQTGVLAVVCAPICDKSGQIIGALYGDRQSPIHAPTPIGPEEATFAEALAHTIAVGLQRQTQEKEALEQRVRFDQFFSRELAEQLSKNPEILTAKDALVTILIADIRGFSAVSERMGAKVTLQWIQDTLDELTQIVMQHGGVVVDYMGDAILAMWGAPVQQPDQARRACQAALDMQVALGPLNARWKDQLAVETLLAIGIHTGVTQVGNIGSRRKFKYGALGHTVNLASRVQGATKHLRTSLLITQATHDALGCNSQDSGFLTRRIGAIQVVNIEEPVQVHELRLVNDERQRLLCELYENALSEFESQQFRRAARTLGDYIPKYEDDGPSHILLWRAVNGLVHPTASFDPAWKLPGK